MSATKEDAYNEKAYYVATQRHAWRAGKPLLILGVVYATTRGLGPYLGYKVRDPEDGAEDIIPVYGYSAHHIISESDVKAGRIPPLLDDPDPMEPMHWFNDK